MKRIILLLSLLGLSFSGYAKEKPQFLELMDQASKSLNDEAYETPCDACEESQSNHVYTPQEGLSAILDGPLEYMGRDLFPGNAQNRTCVYKSKSAYILYHNCMANKKEAPATEIQVISFNGGVVRYYIENNGTGPISDLTREQYNMTWTVDVKSSKPVGDKMSFQQIKNFMQGQVRVYDVCFIGSTFKAQDMSSEAGCLGKLKQEVEWKKKAESFWKKPGEDWYLAKKELRRVVEKTKY